MMIMTHTWFILYKVRDAWNAQGSKVLDDALPVGTLAGMSMEE